MMPIDQCLILSFSLPFQFHAAVAEMEQEKFEMQKKHTESIQELLDDTNRRLAKMESEHKARSQATVSTGREMWKEFNQDLNVENLEQ